MRRLLFRSCVMGALLVSLGSSTALAWGKTGHKVVAAIAWANLSPAARTKAIALLLGSTGNSGLAALRPTAGADATRNAQFFIVAATWPDLIRNGRLAIYSHPGWHFADHYWQMKSGHAQDVPGMAPDDTNSVERLIALTRALAATSRSASTTSGADDANPGVELAWILHLMGDLHQPLHNSSRVTPAFPQGDRGGNSVKLSSSLNLHSFWDDILDEAYEADPAVTGTVKAKKAHEKEASYIDNWAATIMSEFPVAKLPKTSDFATWSVDGETLAEGHAYKGIKAMQKPSAAYRTDVTHVCKQSIAEAGYRLAALLNSLLA